MTFPYESLPSLGKTILIPFFLKCPTAVPQPVTGPRVPLLRCFTQLNEEVDLERHSKPQACPRLCPKGVPTGPITACCSPGPGLHLELPPLPASESAVSSSFPHQPFSSGQHVSSAALPSALGWSRPSHSRRGTALFWVCRQSPKSAINGSLLPLDHPSHGRLVLLPWAWLAAPFWKGLPALCTGLISRPCLMALPLHHSDSPVLQAPYSLQLVPEGDFSVEDLGALCPQSEFGRIH